jgi:Ca-activated chloride channel family protein
MRHVMPEFTHPWLLLLLLAVPPALWYWQRRSRGAMRYSSAALLAGLPAGRATWLRRGGLALRGLGAAAAVVALAGPRWPDEGTRIPAEGLSIAVVLDVSASMAEEDFPWQNEKISRLEGVKRVFRLFVAGGTVPGGTVPGGTAPGGTDLPGRPEDLVALVTFATRPETACPLTLDHRALLRILDAQQPRDAADVATTNPGDALAWALHVLKKAPTRHRLIVFLTDGESNVPRGLRPRQAAQLAANYRVPVYALDAAPTEAAPGEDPGDAVKARETLQTIARMTGGAYYRANDPAALAEACRQIDRLEKDRFATFHYRRYYEGFAWFTLAALVCWSLVLMLEATVWRRTP